MRKSPPSAFQPVIEPETATDPLCDWLFKLGDSRFVAHVKDQVRESPESFTLFLKLLGYRGLFKAARTDATDFLFDPLLKLRADPEKLVGLIDLLAQKRNACILNKLSCKPEFVQYIR